MAQSPDLEADEQDEAGGARKASERADYMSILFGIGALVLCFLMFRDVETSSHELQLTLAKEAAEEQCNRKWVEALLKIPYEGQRQPLIFSWAKPDEVQRRIQMIIWK